MAKIQGESKLSFFEATGIIVGHGVGAGILAVPALAARNSMREILLILCFCYLFNLVLHLIIAELSYNNGGAHPRRPHPTIRSRAMRQSVVRRAGT